MLRLPAEWEPQSCVWVSPPHAAISWPTDSTLEAAAQQHADFRNAIADVTPIRTPADLGLQPVDSWLRDTGPLFVEQPDPHPANGQTAPRLATRDFIYNAYGNKWSEMLPDDGLAADLARALDLPSRRVDLVLEGGAVESNGAGTLMLAESCVVDPQRNPGRSREEIDRILADSLGADRILWLPAATRTGIEGDLTDGHIDNVARFVAEDRIVCVSGIDGEVTASLREQCPKADLIELPLPGDRPGALSFDYPEDSYEHGRRPLPASYANFLISNGSVFVPVFNLSTDDRALRLIESAMPRHRVVPCRAEALVVGGGTLHCLSMQQPADPAGR